MDLLGATICKENSMIQGLCSNVLFLMAGYDADQLNTVSSELKLIYFLVPYKNAHEHTY